MKKKIAFGQQVLAFHRELKPNMNLPKNIGWIDAYQASTTLSIFSQFLDKFYSDAGHRTYLFGINPGRFGAGVTGVAFTDPILLEKKCGIDSPFTKKHELSALFIHEMIAAYGGVKAFYKQFYITSLCPLGLIKDGKNYNYYDDAETLRSTLPFVIESINAQIQFGCHRDKAFCLGKGTNFKVFNRLNKENQWFKEIIPLPHPRWVMQYRRKQKIEFIDEYLQKLTN
ncbi:MAG: DUF4918 family protein [Saprospiraceae bacterium]|nr:DUF4918 family protein [Saprospiraceae bacterium]